MWNSAIEVSRNQSVRLGDPIMLLCNVTGSRARSRDVSWYRGESAVKNQSAGVLVTRRCIAELRSTRLTLLIKSSRPRDAGLYTCRTDDGQLAASTFVHVTPDGTVYSLRLFQSIFEGSQTARVISAVFWLRTPKHVQSDVTELNWTDKDNFWRTDQWANGALVISHWLTRTWA